jgi:hypothetical protein
VPSFIDDSEEDHPASRGTLRLRGPRASWARLPTPRRRAVMGFRCGHARWSAPAMFAHGAMSRGRNRSLAAPAGGGDTRSRRARTSSCSTTTLTFETRWPWSGNSRRCEFVRRLQVMSAFGQTGHRADMAPRPVLTLRSPEGEPQPEGPKQGLDVVSALLRWGLLGVKMTRRLLCGVTVRPLRTSCLALSTLREVPG